MQDKVVSSVSELYAFMDGADTTLALKVLGEVVEGDEGGGSGGAAAPAADDTAEGVL
jgi:hypothetical protein